MGSRTIHASSNVADVPGRHEPGTGELDWPEIYATLARSGFSGDVTFEYLPSRSPVESLASSLRELRRGTHRSERP